MTRYTSSFALALVIAMCAGLITTAAARPAQAQAGQISGVAQGGRGERIADVVVRIRSQNTGTIVNSVKSGADGTFSAGGLAPGTYVAEVVDAAGKLLGVSAPVTVAPGAVIAGVVVTTTAAGVAAAAGTGGLLSFLGSAAGVAAIAGGVATAAIVTTRSTASASR